MTDHKREIILQKIEITRGLKNVNRRKKVQSRAKGHVSEKVSDIVRAPRSFRRQNIDSSPNRNKIQKIDWSNRKDYLISKHMPVNLKYLLFQPESPFYLKKIKKDKFNSSGLIPGDNIIKANKHFAHSPHQISCLLPTLQLLKTSLYCK